MKKLKPGKTNKEDRMNFVKYWAEYVRTHDDQIWGEQQNMLINAQMQSSASFFSKAFGKEHFKERAREYLKKQGLI